MTTNLSVSPHRSVALSTCYKTTLARQTISPTHTHTHGGPWSPAPARSYLSLCPFCCVCTGCVASAKRTLALAHRGRQWTKHLPAEHSHTLTAVIVNIPVKANQNRSHKDALNLQMEGSHTEIGLTTNTSWQITFLPEPAFFKHSQLYHFFFLLISCKPPASNIFGGVGARQRLKQHG